MPRVVHFEVQARDGGARLGRFSTPQGTVTTPALLPVVHPAAGRQAIPPREMAERFGVQMVITNAYITWRTPGLREQAVARGIAATIGFPGPVMTDSGTFQMYFYRKGALEIDNAGIVGFQRDIRSTVGTILDLFGTPDLDEAQAKASVDETLSRAREAQGHRGDMALALPVQGALHPHLRERCAREMGGMEAGVHPIGGVVPLMENQRYADLVRVIAASQRGLPAGRPVHLFGAGHPMMFPIAALLGCDLFDSASYAKFAHDDRLLLPEGTVHLADLEELPCACPVCSSTTAKELRGLGDAERSAALARHNLHVSMAELRRVREAIRQGRLWELVERRCRSHPSLLEALRVATQPDVAGSWLDARDPVSKRSALFYTGPETLARPDVVRLRARLTTRYASPCKAAVVLPDLGRPFARGREDAWAKAQAAGVQLLAKTFLGAVPLEVDAMYPVAQSAEPAAWDRDAGKGFTRHLDAMVAAHGWKLLSPDEAEALTDGLTDGPAQQQPSARDGGEAPMRFAEAAVRANARMQFGPAAADALLAGAVTLRVSRASGRARNVYADGAHVLSPRAGDGWATLKVAGAQRIHAALPAPALRVPVEADAVPFALEGRNVFARFVQADGMDPTLRPGDECLVVGPDDALLAVGRVVLTAPEVGSFARGIAVQVRTGLASGADDADADEPDAEDAQDAQYAHDAEAGAPDAEAANHGAGPHL